MKVRKFRFSGVELKYYVGISQIKFDGNYFLQTKKNEEHALNYLFNMIEELQSKYKDMTIQFVKDDYILNENHIYVACYYMEKAFLHNTAISQKKNIELLLYLSTYRQINKSINAFGV
ncbi:MAG: KEOPS complex subunit Cgi121, partial [Promethearchaeota archaeon]